MDNTVELKFPSKLFQVDKNDYRIAQVRRGLYIQPLTQHFQDYFMMQIKYRVNNNLKQVGKELQPTTTLSRLCAWV